MIRLLTSEDAEEITALYVANRDFLAPFEPDRTDEFFTVAYQRRRIEAGGEDLWRWAILDGDRVENNRVGAVYDGAPAVVLDIQRQPGANIVQTVQAIRQELPRLRKAIPSGIKLSIVTDRTETIRASVRDVQYTLIMSVVLVVLVIFVFLRSARATFIPAIALPLSLIGTFGIMDLLGFGLDNLSLMALTIATGFVVDDAIVMIENVVRFIERGVPPLEAAFRGAAQIGFTIVSLTVSLIAVFIPLLFMTGVVGRLFKEFSVTLSVSVVVSAVVSLTLTPMMCGRLLRPTHETSQAGSRAGASGASTACWPATGAPWTGASGISVWS